MIGFLRIFKNVRKRLIRLSLENRKLKLQNKELKIEKDSSKIIIENLVAYLESKDKVIAFMVIQVLFQLLHQTTIQVKAMNDYRKNKRQRKNQKALRRRTKHFTHE